MACLLYSTAWETYEENLSGILTSAWMQYPFNNTHPTLKIVRLLCNKLSKLYNLAFDMNDDCK